jgi:hypothetical protein
MATLTSQRCLNHAAREAAARCPECGRFFCRECVVEHEQRVICAGCLARLAAPVSRVPRRLRFSAVLPVAGFGIGFLMAWLAFYFVGRMLLAVPDDFHANKIWKADWLQFSPEDGR